MNFPIMKFVSCSMPRFRGETFFILIYFIDFELVEKSARSSASYLAIFIRKIIENAARQIIFILQSGHLSSLATSTPRRKLRNQWIPRTPRRNYLARGRLPPKLETIELDISYLIFDFLFIFILRRIYPHLQSKSWYGHNYHRGRFAPLPSL